MNTKQPNYEGTNLSHERANQQFKQEPQLFGFIFKFHSVSSSNEDAGSFRAVPRLLPTSGDRLASTWARAFHPLRYLRVRSSSHGMGIDGAVDLFEKCSFQGHANR